MLKFRPIFSSPEQLYPHLKTPIIEQPFPAYLIFCNFSGEFSGRDGSFVPLAAAARGSGDFAGPVGGEGGAGGGAGRAGLGGMVTVLVS